MSLSVLLSFKSTVKANFLDVLQQVKPYSHYGYALPEQCRWIDTTYSCTYGNMNKKLAISVISSNPPRKDGNAQFITVPLKPLFYH